MPTLALLIVFVFIGWLFRLDMRWRQLPSTALWIAGIWLAQSSSRSIGYWLATIGIGGGGSSNLEGNTINSIFNGAIFLVAIVILNRRGFRWGEFIVANKALFSVLFFFCAVFYGLNFHCRHSSVSYRNSAQF